MLYNLWLPYSRKFLREPIFVVDWRSMIDRKIFEDEPSAKIESLENFRPYGSYWQ